MIEPQRISLLAIPPVNEAGAYVLYWMQAAQRVRQNEALAFAIEQANALKKPLVVYFGLERSFSTAQRRHFQFMLEGLAEVQQTLHSLGIPFWVHHDGILAGLAKLMPSVSVLVTDRAYTRTERLWRKQVAHFASCPFFEIETNVVVPLKLASDKQEYSAATLRRKIERMIGYFAQSIEIEAPSLSTLSLEPPFKPVDLSDFSQVLDSLSLEQKGGACPHLKGGETQAHAKLSLFIESKLDGYATLHNDPSNTYSSSLSPYLHFGQISAIDIYHAVKDVDLPDVPVFLEELIVRRELAYNYAWYNPLYDAYEGLPAWALKSLAYHEQDRRPVLYSFAELEQAQTHDPYWNAAQRELTELGTMHNYLRMYWGKKIIEWSPTPKEAFNRALALNNTYQMDGRDPNGYAGVAWCFGTHDRPWAERPIFGNIRYMNDKGLERKFDMSGYIARIEKEIALKNRLS